MTQKSTALLCPCQSEQPYEHCCGKFHQYINYPLSAEQLMRSRYSAYALRNTTYIIETTVPAQQSLLDKSALQNWANSTNWLKLQILNQETLSRTQSAVEFKAFFGTDERPQIHHERSIFVKIAQRWYFIDPTVPLPTNKQPCLCGSGKKFKHCCGEFL
ncbi:YchJ family protein [Rodentibacter caecimuris]|uniref:UPF0225 protein BKG89_05000 n=1 Tax=Rodentibacter caecimuris TaxID=1796644 RepID=A0ABX3L1C0_9PAST|nr:SEC-C motif-containing protein [Rodentibacter heylii]